MIAAALAHVAGHLNESLRRAFATTEEPVVLTALIDGGGAAVPMTANKLVMFLVNIEREIATPVPMPAAGGVGRIGFTQPPLHVNLLTMFAANCTGPHYPEGLKLLGATLAHFQAHPVLDHRTSPGLDPGIERLALEMETVGLADLGHVWGMLGNRHLPSVMYRLRMVTFASPLVDRTASPVVRTRP